MSILKQKEDENQEFIFPDNLSRIALLSFYIILISAGVLFYNFVVLTEIEKVKTLDFASRYEIMGVWINFTLGFFLIPSLIMAVYGIKIIRTKRCPSFGARVAVKTKIIRGEKATALGKMYLVFGIAASLLICASIVGTDSIRKSFVQNPMKWATKKSWEKAGLKKPKLD